MLKQRRGMTEYRNIKIDGKTITGEHKRYDSWMSFSGNLDLMKIRLVIDSEDHIPKAVIRKIWNLSDGFGKGVSSRGDWSGIRDSSPEAIAAMLKVAEDIWQGLPWPWE
jgi:hypothetical protein